MANSGRANQAIEYYYQALELNPGYIRARSASILFLLQSLTLEQVQFGNIIHQSQGTRVLSLSRRVSNVTFQRYEEATQHILDALVLQQNDGSEDVASIKRGVASAVLWDTLKTTSLHLQRPDLTALCDSRDLEGNTFSFLILFQGSRRWQAFGTTSCNPHIYIISSFRIQSNMLLFNVIS